MMKGQIRMSKLEKIQVIECAARAITIQNYSMGASIEMGLSLYCERAIEDGPFGKKILISRRQYDDLVKRTQDKVDTWRALDKAFKKA